MPRQCSCCSHPERAEVERELIAGTPYRDLAGRFGLSRTSLARHSANHLGPMSAATNRARERDLFTETERIIAVVDGVLQRAERAGDDKLLLLAVREARGNLELLAKLRGAIDERPQINVLLAAPEWLPIFAAIRRVLVRYPGAVDAVDAAVAELEARAAS